MVVAMLIPHDRGACVLCPQSLVLWSRPAKRSSTPHCLYNSICGIGRNWLLTKCNGPIGFEDDDVDPFRFQPAGMFPESDLDELAG
jgi:hypothetical protein